MNFKTCIVIFFCVSISSVVSFDFVAVPAIAIAGLSALAKFTYDHTVCKLKECCSENEIPADFAKLQRMLSDKVYGQHLVDKVVVNALKAHWRATNLQKPLTLSFHGWPGGGKNYVTKFIQESIYAKGGKSEHVHHFIGRIHFSEQAKTGQYKADLYTWIKGNVTRCPQQLFIFDEVDKIPPSVLNVLKPMIDYNEHVERVDYRKSVFIFLSNTGSVLITEHYLKLWKNGLRREDIQLKDFEKFITEGAFNEEGGFHHSDTIKSNLIDHYIPFLPMEHDHVRLCILDEFKMKGIWSPSEEDIEEVMDFIEWGPVPHNLFSKTGCKRISQKVAMIVQKNYYT